MASEVGQSPLHSHEVSFALLHGAGKGSRTPVNRLETCGNAVIPYPLLRVPPKVRPSPQNLGLRSNSHYELRPAPCFLYPQQESNPHHELRKLAFCPLNYGGMCGIAVFTQDSLIIHVLRQRINISSPKPPEIEQRASPLPYGTSSQACQLGSLSVARGGKPRGRKILPLEQNYSGFR